MSLPGIEVPVREVIDVLQKGMATKLAAFSYSDGLTPAAPDTANYFWRWPKLLPTPPVVIVSAAPESADNRNVPSEVAMTYALQVDFVVRADDPASSDVALWRYWRAAKEILCATNALVCGDCTLVGIDWDQPILTDRESGDELQDIPGLFHVTTYETP